MLGAIVFLGIVIFVIAALPAVLDKAGLGTAGSSSSQSCDGQCSPP